MSPLNTLRNPNWIILLSFVGGSMLASCSPRPEFLTGDGDGDESKGSGGSKGGDGDGDMGGMPGDGDGDASGGMPGDGDGDASGGMSGDGDGDASGGMPGDGDDDTRQVTPPEILTFSPQDGAKGERDDAVLTVTFNEAMDEDSVESAVSLTNHSAAELSFAWDQDSTVLTITPGDLDYAQGSTANKYELVIGSGALDAEGDELEQDAESSFSTLRRVSDTLFAEGVSNFYSYAYHLQDAPQVCPLSSGNPKIGRTVGSVASGDHIVYVSFDTSTLSGASEVELATFRAQQLSPDSGYYPGGSVLLDSLEPGPINSYTVYDLDVESTVGTLTGNANSSVSSTVTAAVVAGLDLHPELQVYRLTHSSTPQNIYAYFSCTGFSLDVTYLTP